MGRYDSLYFSPHLDDVALSCAARVLAERAAGRRVLVATLFTRGGMDDDSRRYYAARRREDARAMARLGADVYWLDLPDASFRDPFYQGFRQIILEEAPGDRDWALEVGRVVRALWEEVRPERVFLPLAVGTHIDHRLTFGAAGVLPAGARALFYEDRPYVFLSGNLRMRLGEIGARLEAAGPSGEGIPPELAPAPRGALVADFLSSLREAGYVRSWLPGGPERLRCVLRMARRLTGPAPATGPRLRPEIVSVDAACLERIDAAVLTYRSQIGALFGTEGAFRAQSAAYSARLGGAAYAERYWETVADEVPRRPGGE